MSFCTQCSTGSKPPTPFISLAACTKPFLTKCGIKGFGLVNCELELDPTDPVAVEAAVAAGDIILGVYGKITKSGTANTTVENYDGCFNDLILVSEETYRFESYHTDSTGQCLDYKYFTDICNNHKNWKIFLIGCNGELFLSEEWSTWLNSDQSAAKPDASIGYNWSLTSNPDATQGQKGYCLWVMEFKIEKTCTIVPAKIDGFLETLTAG